MTQTSPRAPAVAAKLADAKDILVELTHDLAELALEASEGKAGAEKALAAHRSKIEAAERNVAELRGAVALAERLDRQNAADGVGRMRADQLRDFRTAMAARRKAMAVVLEAAATMAKAYGEYSEATLAAAIATPAGTVAPQVAMGRTGELGPSFGPCERLLLAELWRLGPDRKDGVGRFIVPFAKAAPLMTTSNPRDLPVGIDEFRKADEVIIAEIEKQLERMNSAARATIAQEAA
jgi:hypothetical protein